MPEPRKVDAEQPRGIESRHRGWSHSGLPRSVRHRGSSPLAVDSRRRLVGLGLEKSNEAPDPGFDRDAYRGRNVVERTINRLKRWRRTATRYEKRAANYFAMLTFAPILLWL